MAVYLVVVGGVLQGCGPLPLLSLPHVAGRLDDGTKRTHKEGGGEKEEEGSNIDDNGGNGNKG